MPRWRRWVVSSATCTSSWRSRETYAARHVVSDLLAAQDREQVTDEGIAGMAAMLLFAGHETSATRIDLGTLLLLHHRDQLDALRADPGLLDGTVEEILRLASPGSLGGLPRYVHADIDIAAARPPRQGTRRSGEPDRRGVFRQRGRPLGRVTAPRQGDGPGPGTVGHIPRSPRPRKIGQPVDPELLVPVYPCTPSVAT